MKAVGYRDGQESSEGKTLNLITRKFSKFLNKNNNKNQSSNKYNSKKLNDFNYNNYTYFGYGKQGHIKADCPNNESNEKRENNKFEKKGKAKRAYIA